MSAPRIDVVILSWNDGDLLQHAVASALASERVDVSVLVVDNGSDPPARVVDDPRVRLVRNDENRGVPGGRNQGASASTAPYVCLLDSDARLLPDCLSALHAALVAESDVGVAAPVFTGQAPEASAGRAPSVARKVARGLDLVSAYASTPRHDQRQWEVEFAIGACQLVRREAFESVGGLDDRYLFGPEDVDFCLRLRQKGWRVVQVADAHCDHPPRRAHRRLLTRRGLAHSWALVRHYWRHRSQPRAG
jgi:N-acetylglucosaminyl-diphospho-decaprenol L-rhamnosyltransferase